MKELFRTAPKQQNYVELKAGENSNSLSFLKIASHRGGFDVSKMES